MEAVLTSLIPTLVAEKVFGDGEFVCIEEENGASIGAQFSSELAFVNLKLRRKCGELCVFPLVVKLQNLKDHQGVKDYNAMFYNEVSFYREILPALDTKNEVKAPKMYYGLSTCGENPEKDVLILENLKVAGYELPRIKSAFLDFDHISEAMKCIGKLHSMSYTLKYREPKKFQDLIGKFKKRGIFLGNLEKMAIGCMNRGINHALKYQIETEVLTKFSKVLESLASVSELLRFPHEPFGVIIHGDFCKNNVLYKYDSNNKPIDCAFVDFQFSDYCSPLIDICFFLYMHTTAEIRDQHWDDFLSIYWKSVEDNVEPGVQLPTCEEFLKCFSRKAIYGYFPSSFFLPFLLFYDGRDLSSMSDEMFLDYHVNLGGDEGTKLLIDIVLHLVKKNYLHDFLDFYGDNLDANVCLS